MAKKHDDNPLSEEAKFLMRYLEQYKYCKTKKKLLEKRRESIIQEFDYPISGIQYSSQPAGNVNDEGSAKLSLMLDDINTLITQQIEEAAKTLQNIIVILQLLPANETERTILEAKYIDCAIWSEICDRVNLSRTPAYNYMKDGLNKLLTFPEVQTTLTEFKKELIKDGVVVLHGQDISGILLAAMHE